MSEQPSSTPPAALRPEPAAMACPTCRAAWRGVPTCPRCGTDLTALMRVAVRAWELRQAARAALCAGDRTEGGAGRLTQFPGSDGYAHEGREVSAAARACRHAAPCGPAGRTR